MSHTEPNDKRVERAREFLEFFGSETLTHFREEEEEIFPLAVGEPEAESVLARTMMEHLQIHAAVHRLSDQVAAGNAPGESLTRIGELLESHIRSEEKTVFPLIERLAPQALDAVELSPRKRTA